MTEETTPRVVAVNRGVEHAGTQGDTTRSTAEFSDGHRVQTVLHERADDGMTYTPSMKVTLTKVE
jgi:hypothetical protein